MKFSIQFETEEWMDAVDAVLRNSGWKTRAAFIRYALSFLLEAGLDEVRTPILKKETDEMFDALQKAAYTVNDAWENSK